jgi:uncharacterized membrane protein
MDTQPGTKGKDTIKKILRYFIQGLIIIAPIALTVWAIVATFTFIDNLLPNLIHNIFPGWIHADEKGNLKKIPGLGFIVIILFVILVGWISSHFLMSSFIHFFDQWMERTPVVKFIYTSTKDFFEAFAGEKRKFSKAVLANIFGDDTWIVGFLTDEEMQKFNLGGDKVAVYVPQSYHWAGQLYILPRDKVRNIDKVGAGEAMKYAVTGGVVDLDLDKTEDPGAPANKIGQPELLPENLL